jgi:ABC-type multidrug transport system fused ATPase/permease subunit
MVWQRWRFTLGTIYNILAEQLPVVAIFMTFFFHTKVFDHSLDPSSAFVAFTVFDRVKSALQVLPEAIQKAFDARVAIERLVAFLNQPEVVQDDWSDYSEEIVIRDAVIAWPTGIGSAKDTAGTFKLKASLEIPKQKLTIVLGPLGSGKTLLVCLVCIRLIRAH